MDDKSLINRDCKHRGRKPRATASPRSGVRARTPWRLGFVLAGVLCIVFLSGLAPLPGERSGEAEVPSAVTIETTRRSVPLTLPSHASFLDRPASSPPTLVERGELNSSALPAADVDAHSRKAVKVAPGDTLAAIFKRSGLNAADLHAAVTTSEHGEMLAHIRPGQELEIAVDAHEQLAGLDYRIDTMSTLKVRREGERFRSELVRTEVEARYATAAASISHSLFLAGQEAGLSDQLIMQLVEIFGWDVDFALDIRSGDRLAVVFEELYAQGEKVANGDIVAAQFVNGGRTLRAVRYSDGQAHTGYYTPDGLSMRRAFLRTPVRFSRISSRFQRKRWHPKLHRFRAHRGVDYAAPRGTPVKATGGGAVSALGRKGGYGKTIILRHGNGYTTLYAHLSRYRRGLRVGSRVEQGQIIGYVGSTGLATGPHLHYEFRVRGAHRNPLTIELPKAASIAAAYREDFGQQTRPLLAQLEVVSRVQLAQGERN